MYNSIISIVLLVVIVSFSFLTEYRATKIEGYIDVPTCEDENVPMCSYNIDEDALNQNKVDMDNFMLKTECLPQIAFPRNTPLPNHKLSDHEESFVDSQTTNEPTMPTTNQPIVTKIPIQTKQPTQEITASPQEPTQGSSTGDDSTSSSNNDDIDEKSTLPSSTTSSSPSSLSSSNTINTSSSSSNTMNNQPKNTNPPLSFDSNTGGYPSFNRGFPLSYEDSLLPSSLHNMKAPDHNTKLYEYNTTLIPNTTLGPQLSTTKQPKQNVYNYMEDLKQLSDYMKLNQMNDKKEIQSLRSQINSLRETSKSSGSSCNTTLTPEKCVQPIPTEKPGSCNKELPVPILNDFSMFDE